MACSIRGSGIRREGPVTVLVKQKRRSRPLPRITLAAGTVVLLLFAAAILCLVKAYQGQYFKLPVIGNFAEKFSAK